MIYFLIILLLAYISPFYTLLFTRYKNKKEYIYSKNNLILKILNFKIFQVSEENISRIDDIIYLSNHSSFFDIITDMAITNYSTCYISRYMTLFAFPFYAISSLLSDSLIFIIRDKNYINIMEDKILNFQKKHIGENFILTYPEGTRRYGNKLPINLKKGIIYFSYKYKKPLQFIITKNKEKIFNEKKFTINKDVNLYVHFSIVYNPENFSNINDYYNYINEEWKIQYIKILNMDEKDFNMDKMINKNFIYFKK